MDLDRVAGHRDAEAGCLELDEGWRDAQPCWRALLPLAVGVTVAVEDNRLHRFDIDDHLGELAAH